MNILNEARYPGEALAWELHPEFSRVTRTCSHAEVLQPGTLVALEGSDLVPWDPDAVAPSTAGTVIGFLYSSYSPKADGEGGYVAKRVAVVEAFAIAVGDALIFPEGADAAATAAIRAQGIAALAALNIKVR